MKYANESNREGGNTSDPEEAVDRLAPGDRLESKRIAGLDQGLVEFAGEFNSPLSDEQLSEFEGTL